MSAAVLTEVVNSGAWFVVGLAAGYLAGRLRREVGEIREAVVDDDTDDTDPGGAGGRGGLGGPSHWPGNRVIGLVVILLAVATVVQGYVFGQQQAHLVTCQARFTHEFTDALRIRTRIADEDRENARRDRRSIHLWLQELRAHPGDPVAARRITDEYLAEQDRIDVERRRLDTARAATPLPTLPDECQ